MIFILLIHIIVIIAIITIVSILILIKRMLYFHFTTVCVIINIILDIIFDINLTIGDYRNNCSLRLRCSRV